MSRSLTHGSRRVRRLADASPVLPRMARMSPHRLTAAAATAAAVVITALASPAQALPPTSRVVKDAVEPGKAYDIIEVKLRSAPKSTRPAVVLVKHGRARQDRRRDRRLVRLRRRQGARHPRQRRLVLGVHRARGQVVHQGRQGHLRPGLRAARDGRLGVQGPAVPGLRRLADQLRGGGEVLAARTCRTAPTTGRRRPRSSPRRCSPRRSPDRCTRRPACRRP